MTTPTPTARTSATILRQAVVHPDRSIFSYAVRGVVPDPHGEALAEQSVEHLVDAMFRGIDMARVAGERPVLVRATTGLLSDPGALLGLGDALVLEVPPYVQARTTAPARLASLAEQGIRVALGDYSGSDAQSALLQHVQLAKVDASQDPHRLRVVVARCLEHGAVVIAENVTTRERADAALDAGVELLQGPLVLDAVKEEQTRSFDVGEIQCLELIRLVSGESPDPAACAQTVARDPALSMRVLHLVNSSAMGVRHKVDSVHRAVMLVGPRQLGALATASLVGSSPAAMETLWYLLTRATACSTLTGDDTGYTVGLLSAIASQLGVSPASIVSRTGVSTAIAEALEQHTGPYGRALAAVLAQERNDSAAVGATGHDPYDVGHAYLDAVSTALSLASRLAAAS